MIKNIIILMLFLPCDLETDSRVITNTLHVTGLIDSLMSVTNMYSLPSSYQSITNSSVFLRLVQLVVYTNLHFLFTLYGFRATGSIMV